MSCFNLQDMERTKFCFTRPCRRALSGSTATWPTCPRWKNLPFCLLPLGVVGWVHQANMQQLTRTDPDCGNFMWLIFPYMCTLCTAQLKLITPQLTSMFFRRPSVASSSRGPVGSLGPREHLLTLRPRPLPSSTPRRTHRENAHRLQKTSISSVQIFVKEHTWKYGHGVHSVNHRQFSTSVTMRVC